MSQQTIRKLSTFHTPVLVVLPAFSSEEDRLLNETIEKFASIDQAKLHNRSEYIVINQNKSNIPIEDLRTLVETLSYSSFSGDERVVVIHRVDLAAPLAQNTLLKLLEEPPKKTWIFLTAQSVERILETILSRVTISSANFDIQNNDFDLSTYNSMYLSIPQLTYQQLIELAAEHSEKPAAVLLVNGLLQAVAARLGETGSNTTLLCQALQILMTSTKYLEQNVNTKLVLENCLFQLKTLS